MKSLRLLAAIALSASGTSFAQAPTATPARASGRAIDADVWSVVSATVASADIAGMSRTYHPEAVFVGGSGTQPIASLLAKWGKDMAEAKRKGSKAEVAFRFSRRQDDATTAFETGMFRYTVTDKAGTSASQFVPFEALLVRRNGNWRILMERQMAAVIPDAWDKLPK